MTATLAAPAPRPHPAFCDPLHCDDSAEHGTAHHALGVPFALDFGGVEVATTRLDDPGDGEPGEAFTELRVDVDPFRPNLFAAEQRRDPWVVTLDLQPGEARALAAALLRSAEQAEVDLAATTL